MTEIIINGFIYIILTSFLLYLWINEKKLARNIKDYRDKISTKIISDWGLLINKKKIKPILIIHSIVNLIFIIIFFGKFQTNGLIFLVGILNISIMYTKEIKDIKMYPTMFIINIAVIGLQKLILHTNLPIDMLLFFGINALLYLIYVFTDKLSIRKFVDYTETLATALILVLLIQHFYLGNFLVPTGSMEKTIMPGDRLFGNMIKYRFTEPDRGEILVFREPVQNKVLYTKRLIGLPGEKVNIENGYIYINGEKLTKDIYDNEYSQVGRLGIDTWKIPEKGDKISLGSNKIFDRTGKEILEFDLEKVQSLISKNPEQATELIPRLELKINDKYITGPILDLMYDENQAKKLINGGSIILKQDYYFVLGDNSNNSYDSRFWGFVSEDRIKGKPFFRFWPLNRIGLIEHEKQSN